MLFFRVLCRVIFLLVLTVNVTKADFQTIEDQNTEHLDPSLNSETEHIVKDPAKRTIFPPQPHIYIARHVGVLPTGHKYLLGYQPLDVKLRPPVKHFKLFKQVRLHAQPKPVVHVKSVVPVRQYLPVAVQKDYGWKPAKPLLAVKPPYISLLPPKPIIASPPPPPPQIQVVQVQPEVQVAPVHAPPQIVHAPPPIVHAPPPIVHAPAPLAPAPAPVLPAPVLPAPVHHNYFLQTPVSRPVLVPQFQHVLKPNLGVLPLGATFPARVLPAPAPVAHPLPVFPPQPVAHPAPVHIHGPVHLPRPIIPAQLPVPAPLPVHHPVALPPPHHHQHIPVPQHPVNVVPAEPPHHTVHPFHKVPISSPAHPSFPNFQQRPLFVEFHGISGLNPFGKSHFPNPEESPAHHPEHEIPTPHVGPPNVQHYTQEIHEQNYEDQSHHQFQNNYHQDHGYAQNNLEPIGQNIQPGQSDIQLPLHLPDHPAFRMREHFNEHQNTDHNLEQFSQQYHSNPYHTITFQTHGNLNAFSNHQMDSIQRKGEADDSEEVGDNGPPFKPSQRLLPTADDDKSDEVYDEE